MGKVLMAVILFVGFMSPARLQSQSTERYEVVFFLSPTCKICQFYSIYFRELPSTYDTTAFHFRALMPGKLVTDEIASDYKSEYKIPFSVSRDTGNEHLKLNATVTPEVFVLNSMGEVIYHGRIDDSYAAVGKRRTHVKHHELDDVLSALKRGERLAMDYQQPVGCIIEKNQ